MTPESVPTLWKLARMDFDPVRNRLMNRILRHGLIVPDLVLDLLHAHNLTGVLCQQQQNSHVPTIDLDGRALSRDAIETGLD